MAPREQVTEDEARALVRRIAEGDEEALHRFYQLYSARVYRFCLTRLDNEADAADVLNEVMLEVWRSAAARFRGDAKVGTWLLGIASHRLLDRLRRRGRQEDSLEQEALEGRLDRLQAEAREPLPATERAVQAAQDLSLLRRCLERLSGLLRQALYLAFFEERSYPEIAEILGCPTGTVKTRVFHGRRQLQRCLEEATEPDRDP